MAYTYKYPRPAVTADWWSLSDFLDKPSGIAERPHLAFDHYDIMQDAVKVFNRHKE